MKLHTPTQEEAAALLAGPACFLGCQVVEEALPPAFLLERALGPQCSHWLMPRLFLDDTRREVVGSACFIAEPGDRKVVIGYGVSRHRQGRGFATAGVALLVKEAFASSLVDAVVASSAPANAASRRVLEKSGFAICGSGVDPDEGPVDLWMLPKPPTVREI